MSAVQRIWDVLSTTPWFGVGVTLVFYQFGCRLQKKLNGDALCNPVLIAISSIIALLQTTGTDYKTYFQSATVIDLLLGPAIVALAVPLYRNIGEIKQAALPILGAVFAGAVAAAGSAISIVWILGNPAEILSSIGPKSVTTPIAIRLSVQLGGIPELTAVLVVATGVLVAACGPQIAALAGVRCPRAVGLAAGVAGHGIATARMLSVSEKAGAFAGLAMGLCGLLSAILLPIGFHLMRRL